MFHFKSFARKNFIVGFYVIMLLSQAVLNAATIRVNVKDNSGAPITNAVVGIAGVQIGSTTGDPDPNNFKLVQVSPSGVAELLNAPANYDYIVAVVAPGYAPTAREQIFNPQFMPVRIMNFSDSITIDRIMTPINVTQIGGILRFNVSGIPVDLLNKVLVADVRNAQTDAPIGIGFGVSTATAISLYAFNLPPASSSTYRAHIMAMANPPRAVDVDIMPELKNAQILSVAVDFSSASAVIKSGGDTVGGTSGVRPAFSGVVWSTGTNPSDTAPLSNAIVQLFRKRDDTPPWDFREAQMISQTLTDAGGNFAFYNISAGTYAVQAVKQGYMGVWSPGWIYDGSGNYTIPLPQYFLFKGLGRIKGRVLAYDQNTGGYQGVSNAYVNVWGMGDTWPVISGDPYDNFYTTGTSRGGKGWGSVVTDALGNFEITGLSEGNFGLNIYSEISQGEYNFSAGENRQNDYATDPVNGWWSRSGDDLRIQVNVHPSSSTWAVYNAAGNKVNYPMTDGDSPIIEVVITTLTYRTGTISGKLTFKDYEKYPELSVYSGGSYKVKVSSIDSVSIYAYEVQGSPRKIYTYTFSSPASDPVVNYSINVATGTAYYLMVRSTKWATLYQTDNLSNLVNTTQITGKDITLVPAGAMKIVAKYVNGNVLKRTQQDLGGGKWLTRWIRYIISGPFTTRQDDNDQDVWYGIAPGVYKVGVEWWEYNELTGKTTLLAPGAVVENVVVSAGHQTDVEITIRPGSRIIPSGASLAMPPLPPSTPGGYAICGFKAGSPINSKVLSKTLFTATQGNKDPSFIGIGYSNNKWEETSAPDGKYDFYLGYVNIFSPTEHDGMPVNFRQSYTVFAPLQGVDVKYDELQGNTTTYLNFGAGSLGNAAITGKLRGSKFFTAEDVEKIKQSGFDKFFEYIPTVMIYDQQGAFKGYSAAMPTQARMPGWESAVGQDINNLSYDWIKQELANYPLEYWCEKLPAGKYTLVFEHPNYPPMVKQVELASGMNTFDFDMDDSKVTGVSVSGVVKSTDGIVLMGANVKIANRNASIEKETQTDESGAFKVVGLVPGVYRVEVSRPDYANGGDKISVGKDGVDNVEIKLSRADAAISGTVFTQRFPAKYAVGAKVVAYNETENTNNPGKYLAVYKTITDKNGSYRIPGLLSGNKYKVYCIMDGYNLMWRDETINAGENTGKDYFLTPTRPRLQVQFKKMLENKKIAYNILITCPAKLINPNNPQGVAAPYCRYSPVTKIDDPFDESKATELLVVPGPNNTYSATFQTPSESKYFKMRILATDGANNYFEDVVFGPQIDVKVKKDVTSELAEGGQIEIDSTGGDTTKLGLDAGAITPASVEVTSATVGSQTLPIGGFLSSLPNFNLSRAQSATSLAMQKLVSSIVASEVYEIKLADAQLNRDVTLTLNYDREKVGGDELQNLKIGKYNESTGEWEVVKGVVVPDPLTGTVSIDVGNIGNSGSSSAAPARAIVKDGRYVINKAASTTQSGIYAVFTQDPSSVKAYSGADFSIINFPNPFDLKTKTVTLTDVNSNNVQTITGTMLKYSLPASAGKGRIKFYIYNLAGELVRTLDMGEKDGGYYYYAEWDGKNDDGQDCASGVYFLIAKKGNDKLNSKPLKMAIVK